MHPELVREKIGLMLFTRRLVSMYIVSSEEEMLSYGGSSPPPNRWVVPLIGDQTCRAYVLGRGKDLGGVEGLAELPRSSRYPNVWGKLQKGSLRHHRANLQTSPVSYNNGLLLTAWYTDPPEIYW